MPDTKPSPCQPQPLLGSLLAYIWPASYHINRTPANPIDSDISTQQTVEMMIRLAKVSSHSPLVQAAILSATDGILPSNLQPITLARAIFYFVKGHIHFTEDEELIYKGLGIDRVDKELLITPDVLLAMPYPMGDCDDFSLLTASMLLAGGVPCSFVTIAADPETPEKFSHIYVRAYLISEGQGLGNSVAMDCSHGSYLGWEYQGAFRRQEWLIL